jgi:5-methylcytosine-specific restriction protein A
MPDRPPVHRPPWLKSRQQAERERRALVDKRRPGPRERGYDGEWEKLRAAFLKVHPMCCAVGCTLPAIDVDHIHEVRTHPHLRLEWSNLRPLCHSYHSARTVHDHGFGRSVKTL